MKFTLSWLKEHLDTDAGVDAVAETLTRIGLEVDGIEDPAAATRGLHHRRSADGGAPPPGRQVAGAVGVAPAAANPCRSSAAHPMPAPA